MTDGVVLTVPVVVLTVTKVVGVKGDVPELEGVTGPGKFDVLSVGMDSVLVLTLVVVPSPLGVDVVALEVVALEVVAVADLLEDGSTASPELDALEVVSSGTTTVVSTVMVERAVVLFPPVVVSE